MRSGRPHSLLSAPLGSGWTPELFAAWSLSRFSNVWISGSSFFQCLDTFIECGLASLVDSHPRRVSSAISPGLRKLHPSKAVTSNTTPKAAGQFAPSVRLRCKRRGHLPFRRQDLSGALVDCRAGHRSGWRRLAVAGVATLRGPASPGSLRAHPSRHGADAVSCRLLCATFTSEKAHRPFFADSPTAGGGCRSKNVLTQQVAMRSVRVSTPPKPWRFSLARKKQLCFHSRRCNRSYGSSGGLWKWSILSSVDKAI